MCNVQQNCIIIEKTTPMKAILATIAVIVFSTSACQYNKGSESEQRAAPSGETYNFAVEPEMDEAAPEVQNLQGAVPTPSDPNQLTPASKIIKNASLTIQVKNCDSTRKELDQLNKKFGVIVSNEEVVRIYDRVQVTLAIQVAPEKLDSFLLQLEKLALQVEQRNVTTEDVTQHYVDLESRLKSRKSVIERYQQLLKQAKNVTEVLQVEEKLNYAIEELESAEAQMRVLNSQIKYSQVNLTYYEMIDQPTIGQRSFGSRFLTSLRDGWHFLQQLTLGVFAVWPLWIILAAVIIWWVRRRKRMKG